MASSSGKTVLITGCSRGIGLGLVKEYVGRGYRVLATCRDPEKASDLRDFLSQHGQKPALRLDVASKISIEECKKSVEKDIVQLDVLINNAAISNRDHPDDAASQTNIEEFDQIMKTNVTAVLTMIQAFLPLMRQGSEIGRVINISSALGSMTESTRYSSTSYQCSKAAVNMLTKCFADDVKDVVFVAMHPGWVQTDMGSSKNRSPPVTISDSARGIYETAHKVTLESSGCFLGFDGASIKY